MDPAKLKVIELRAELQQRGLDTKGNKAVLVKRLRVALEAELEEELPDTSIADTSTEELNTSQDELEEKEEAKSDPKPTKESTPEPEIKESESEPEIKKVESEPEPEIKKVESEPKPEPKPELETPASESVQPVQEEESKPAIVPEEISAPIAEETKPDSTDSKDEVQTEKVDETHSIKEPDLQPSIEEKVDEEAPKVEADNDKSSKIEADTDNLSKIEADTDDTSKMEVAEEVTASGEAVEQNGSNANGESVEEESIEPKNRKSRWGAEIKDETPELMEQQPTEQQPIENIAVVDSESRGDKRKHSTPSPDRSNQRRRSKSPTKEDEPVIDPNNVQLNWYDSDLHLQIDKETFLSAKPLCDGAFGYIWSGARLSHGIKTGKVCYEVKITNELEFEDILRIPRERRDKSRDKKCKDDKEKTKTKSDENLDKVESDTAECNEKADESETKCEDVKMEETEEIKEESVDSEEKMDIPLDEKEEKKDVADDSKEEKKDVDDNSKEEKKDVDEDSKEEKKNVDDDSKEEKKDVDDDSKDDTNKSETNKSETKDESENKGDDDVLYIPSHLIRIGWSSTNSSLQLGEDKHSYGLESSGKYFKEKTFTEYPIKIEVGDIVCAYLAINEETINFAFSINGTVQVTTSVDRSEIQDEEFALFPHIITRNYAFQVNVGNEDAWSVHPDEYADFVFISKAEEKIGGASAPVSREECEVIMMCGLPGSGKTHWVKEHVEKTTDKHYTIIGNSNILERMTVDAQPIEEKVNKGRWNVVIDKLTKCLNRLCELAALRRRHFILDQTNVFPSAQRRKMRSFWGFKRHAVIVVNEDEEQARRLKLQESQTGKDMPESAVLEMKANMSIPRTGEWLQKITFISLAEEQAKNQVQKYNAQGREAGFGNIQHRRDYRDDRNYNRRLNQPGMGHRRDYRVSNYRDNRPYHNNRYSDRGPRQGGGGSWRPNPSHGGGGYGGPRNDRRDNRGPRDYRNNNRGGGGGGPMYERHHRGGGGGNRDHRNQGGNMSNFNRNRNQSGSNRNSSWGGQSGGGAGGNWNSSSQSSTSSWSNSPQTGAGQNQGGGNWSGQSWNSNTPNWNQNQWKYGGYTQFPAGWNYYNQYTAAGWGGQGQTGQTTNSASGTTQTSSESGQQQQQQYGQMTTQQQQAAWAQYAQQYVQSTTNQTQK